ncbi:hypothetical protein DES40_1092 [Litorimonas taeanensis]|uniref:MAPEG family protein n=1 Tax=Litorimonas taeanensis TaxID=568099 RepID=A0A420WLH2_9PROT|nr:MAPEG family protein [Litorimonas taeanensis]RKQ71762.1 hypothetical protein DES40_1092 [Litorimonas taeanensis]
MTPETFLAPVMALIVWTLLIWVLLYIRRIPAMKSARMAPDKAKLPDSGWKGQLPLKAQVAAHNYNHLMEQPTLFYALMFYITLTSQTSSILFYLAWAYVALRVVHSFIQTNAGPVMIRFSIFTLSTLVLAVMVGLTLL